MLGSRKRTKSESRGVGSQVPTLQFSLIQGALAQVPAGLIKLRGATASRHRVSELEDDNHKFTTPVTAPRTVLDLDGACAPTPCGVRTNSGRS